MTVFVWILKILLAVLYVAGGAFKMFMSDQLVSQFAGIPRPVWGALGIIEMVGGVLLVVPAALKWMPSLTPAAAVVLAVETLALVVLYAGYSLTLRAENPLVWAAVMFVLVAFLAYATYGRHAQGV
jgi:uncharacterized membrane protein YphA (DoxX/SURF4 family)